VRIPVKMSTRSDLAVGFTTSGAEELHKKLPKAHVVKTFNTVFPRHMDSGKLGMGTKIGFKLLHAAEAA
jgi:predicted dinucleotide-binding enzyme